MNGLLKIIAVLSLFSLISCKNYYYFKGQENVETDHPDKYSKFVLTFDNGNQHIPFYTYGDYQFKKINKQYIFFKNPEMHKLLHDKLPQMNGEQFLFMYTNQPTFSNILGFFYKDMSIEDVKKLYTAVQHREDETQLFSRYNFGKFQVYDFYKTIQGGVVRFISVNNPDYSKDPDYKWFNREINTVFFDINRSLWDGYVDPIN
ncbi:hypothetical protein [Chryseobacterium sp. BIGb0232]|uniref:hypothetical protein n=1 Tax=Chryseobacterium sp. BIGb0232 TaxID=2940598 RepID=UPI000F4A9670|nr:hypothetical protein [Chryseobacterium sp. BIGb0232]MCS4303632.1 hypothetical protein [Chryseobacterium sp. BIGb0232]ROS10331.1 hypothetical protein EDF65_4212 [Chryseobacterium nakagawai]